MLRLRQNNARGEEVDGVFASHSATVRQSPPKLARTLAQEETLDKSDEAQRTSQATPGVRKRAEC